MKMNLNKKRIYEELIDLENNSLDKLQKKHLALKIIDESTLLYSQHMNTSNYEFQQECSERVKNVLSHIGEKKIESPFERDFYLLQKSHTKLFQNFINNISFWKTEADKNLESVWHLRLKEYGLEALQIDYHKFHTELKLFQNDKYLIEQTILLKDAWDIIIDAMKEVSSFQVILKKLKSEDLFDLEKRDNKISHSESFGTYLSKPFVILTYDNTFRSLLDLAHEVGHSYFKEYRRMHFKEETYEYPAFLSEFCAILVELKVLKYCEKVEKLREVAIYYEKQMIDIKVKKAIFLTEFEKNIYDKETVLEDDLNQLFYDISKQYYQNGLREINYLNYIHFYRPFYFVQYFLGVIFAFQNYTNSEIFEKILNGNFEMLQDMLKNWEITLEGVI